MRQTNKTLFHNDFCNILSFYQLFFNSSQKNASHTYSNFLIKTFYRMIASCKVTSTFLPLKKSWQFLLNNLNFPRMDFTFNLLTKVLNQKQKFKITFPNRILFTKMKPINCAFHPKQLIVNFCRNPSCLLPMCPNCVKVHSKQHSSENTFGQFQNIQEVYEQVQLNLQNVLKALVNFNQDLKEVFCQKQSRREAVKKRMSEYRIKVISSIERYIDQLETQILSSMGGEQTNIEDDFNQINEKIESLSKNVEKEFRTLNSEKTLKGIITHLTNNMPDFYDDKLDLIETEIKQLQSKDVTMCKQFRLNQLNPIYEKISEVYKTVFINTFKPVTFKGRQSRISKISKSQVSSTSGFGKVK